MLGGALPGCAGVGAGAGAGAGAAVAAALQFFAAAQCLLGERWPQHADLNNGSSFDFIVVGGGTAGSVLAARLSELPHFRVLLIEAGGDPPLDSVIPAFSQIQLGSEFDWNFTTENDGASSQALEGGKQFQPRGKMLGGTGSLNDMVYARGFPADYDEWALTLGDAWKWDQVIDYFKKTEHMTDEKIVNDPKLMELHSQGGAIAVTGSEESTFTTDKFLEAFKELGFNIVKDMTNPNAIGAGRLSRTIRDGRRDSSATALLIKAAERNNLFILKNTFVSQILINTDRAYGVKVSLEGEDFHYYASKEVIVSAGTFNTPKLLMLSGIGPAEHLTELGIKVVKDLPVGDNLHDHVMVLNHVAVDNGTCYTDEATSHMNMIRYLYDQSGPFSYINSMAAYMAGEDIRPNLPEYAFYPTCMPIGTDFYDRCRMLLRLDENICSTLHNVSKEQEVLTIATVLLKPKSRGKVRLRSANSTHDPLIYSGTFSDERDLAGYPDLVDKVRALVNTSYFRGKNARVLDFDYEVCEGLEGRERVRCRVKAVAMSAWHSVGTAAMGGVLDARLRVRGVSGLRVADASVMPQVIRGNTNAPVVMIAEKAADFIKSDFRRL